MAALLAGGAEAAADGDILQFDRSRVDALVRHDYAKLETMLADGLLYSHDNGSVETTRQAYLAYTKGDTHFWPTGFTLENNVVRTYGDTTIVVGLLKWSSPTGPGARDRSPGLGSRYTAVYCRIKNAWKLVAYHASVIRPPAPKPADAK